MVKKLRIQFVIVTTSLMITLFGGFLIINTIYNNYLNAMEISGMLDWIACSGVFIPKSEHEEHYEVYNLIDEERPIVGLIVDDEGNVISRKVIGAIPEEQARHYVDDNTIKKMLFYGNKKIKIGPYYYSNYKYGINNTLLVIMDDRFYEPRGLWYLGLALLVLIGISALVGITFYLSRFVTRPAEQSLIREKRFISDASHELKTPLGAISINAQALKMDMEDNLCVKNIISESERMNRLIEKLLILSRLDEKVESSSDDINISDICEEIVLTYESVAFENGIELKYDIEPGLFIKGNADEFRQLMVILLDNAIKNTLRPGQIEISCKKTKKDREIAVLNTGKGIRAEDIPHIFERFYTSDISRKNNSFGLGLAIAKAIVDNHKGNITVESIPDKETIFRINI